jgi:hypothetical protein
MKVLGKLSRDNDGLKWEKEEREMNIEHEGKTYEVLTLDRISEITHARLAGGKVVTAETNGTDVWLWSPTMEHADATCFDLTELEPYGIQPLRLVPNEPVTFEGIAFASQSCGDFIICVPKEAVGKQFRCVEIVEEA